MTARARMATHAGVALLAVMAAACGEEAPAAAPPPPEVYVTNVTSRDVPVYLDLVGQTLGSQDTEIRARVEGVLETMNYREGTFVQRGDLLYTIDRKPLEATVAQAKADMATAEARLAKANNDVNRYTPLVKKQAVSQRELDDARSEQDAARSSLEAARAVLESASLDLGYTRIIAPISGLAGTTLVKPGNLVGRGENTLLTTISQIDPILFRVGVTEADYLRLARRRTADGATDSPRAGDIQLTLSDGTVYGHRGKVGVVDRAVDTSTGTLGIQIEFPNPERILRPGQYGRARALLDTKAGALLVPQRAVQELQNLYSVAVVGADNKVAFKNIKVGQRVDTMWVVEEGLTASDRVVVEGLQRIRDGITVDPKPAPAPTGEAK